MEDGDGVGFHVTRRVVDQVVDLRLKASNVFPRMFLIIDVDF